MMITIAEAISDLLFLRDTVVVPGLGAFVKKPVSAKVNPVANHFAMPTSSIVFDPNLREDNDLIVNYLSEKNDIPEEEARKMLAVFVSDGFALMKSGKKLELKDLGALYYDWANDLVFVQDPEVNYNSDAFGLCDFTLEPVLRDKTKDEIKEEIAQQQKEKNTPVTVDEKAVHEDDEEYERHYGWLWIVLGLLLVVAGVVYGLHTFKFIRFPWEKEKPIRVLSGRQVPVTLPVYEWKWEWKEPVAQDTVNVEETLEQPEQTVQPEQIEQPEQLEQQPIVVPEANIRIIAGCFGQEENAARLTNTLKEKGYTSAFYELRNGKWFVSFGRYATDEEAKAALREIRANTEYKAWILAP